MKKLLFACFVFVYVMGLGGASNWAKIMDWIIDKTDLPIMSFVFVFSQIIILIAWVVIVNRLLDKNRKK